MEPTSFYVFKFFWMNLDFLKRGQHHYFVNMSAMQIILNFVFHEHTKHVKVDCHLICDVYDTSMKTS